MKIEAYKCDSCNLLYEYEYVYGIKKQMDMFDLFNSFISVAPDKSNIHYCVTCANDKVFTPAGKIANKAKDREKYDKTVKELLYILKKSLFDKKG